MTFFCWDGFLCLDRRQYILVISMCDVAIKLLFFYPIGDTFVSVVGLTSLRVAAARAAGSDDVNIGDFHSCGHFMSLPRTSIQHIRFRSYVLCVCQEFSRTAVEDGYIQITSSSS